MPDGRHLLAFYIKPHSDHAQIGMVTLPSGDFHPVTNDVSSYSDLALSADGRTLATVLTNIDSSIAWYKPEGGAPLSTTPLRITPFRIAWANEDRLLFTVPRVDIGWIDRATGEVHTFDIGETAAGDYITTCPDGHILFTGFPKGATEPWVFRMDGMEETSSSWPPVESRRLRDALPTTGRSSISWRRMRCPRHRCGQCR